MASSRKEIRSGDGRSRGTLNVNTDKKNARSPEEIAKTAELRKHLKSRRMLTEARKHYVAMVIVLLVFFYLATRALGLFELGGTFFGRVTQKADVILTCPTTNAYDAPIEVTEYVGIDSLLAEKFLANRDSDNLYPNSGLTDTREDGRLSGFEVVDTVPYAKLQIGRDADGTNYLRSTVNAVSDDQSGRTWLPQFFEVAINQDYYFSFDYRSDVRADVLVQFQKANGEFVYRPLFELLSSEGWRKVDGRVAIDDQSFTAARLLVTPKAMGHVDLTRPAVYKLKPHNLSQAILSVAFDDGWKSVYANAYPVLQKYDIKTTQFVVPSFAEQDPRAYMSFGELKVLQNAGHEIASHSYHHCDQTKLQQADLETDFNRTQELLTKNSLGTAKGFAYPYGIYSATTESVLRSKFSYVRTSNDGYNDYYSDTSLLMVKSVEKGTTKENINQWISYAKANNKWLILLYHQIDGPGEYSATKDDFDSHMKLIKDSGISVRPISQAIGAIK